MGAFPQRHASAALLSGKRLVTHCIEGWMDTGLVWMDAKNLATRWD